MRGEAEEEEEKEEVCASCVVVCLAGEEIYKVYRGTGYHVSVLLGSRGIRCFTT